MSRDGGLLDRIARAEAAVANASRSWDPTSASACANCAEALGQAVVEMEAACAAAAKGPAVAGTQARLKQLQVNVNSLARLVDAAMAFNRGLALQAGEEQLTHSEVEG